MMARDIITGCPRTIAISFAEYSQPVVTKRGTRENASICTYTQYVRWRSWDEEG